MTGDGVPVLYIGGLGRSGSTLVDRLLGQTPGVCSVGELVFLWERGLLANERCGCGEPFDGCPFWKEVGVRAFGGWDRVDPAALLARQRRVDRTRYLPELLAPQVTGGFRRRLEPYTEALRRIYAAIAAVSGAALVVDSSKHASTAALVRRTPGISARIVHLVRDPRGVVWSWSKVVARPDTTTGSTSTMARIGTVRAVARWQSTNAALALVRSPGALLRYEDLVDRPAHATRRLLALGGIHLEDLPQFLDDRTVLLGTDHTVAGNPLRFATGPTEIRADDEWRRAMPPTRRTLVAALALPSIAAYRYLP
jgi:hypothetical protein